MNIFIFRKPRILTRTGVGFFIGTFFIVLGLATGLFYLHENSQSKYFSTQSANAQSLLPADRNTASLSGTPVQIQIPSLKINLKVVPGYYYPATKSWSLSPDNAQYGIVTPMPNDKAGSTFIYAHALKGVFADLPNVKPGDVAIVTTDNHHTFTYVFRSSKNTSPGDTSLFNYKGKPILVLQTCSGLWYQNRQLFTFDLSKAT